MATRSVEVVYRGIFQRTMARNIVRNIVFAARKDGKIGTAFGRYSDSPERNGIPAKQFAVVADTALEPEQTTTYTLIIPIIKGMKPQYHTMSIHWEETQ